MIQKTKLWLPLLAIFMHSTNALAQKHKKMEEQPPRLPGVSYRWCQPLTEKQIKQREKMSGGIVREVGKEEGERKYDNRIGRWTFWDKEGKKIAEGQCDPKPSLKETTENGQWQYWDTQGQKISLQWNSGKFDGRWALYDPKGKKVWEYEIHDGKPKKELFADEPYLTANHLRQDPAKSSSPEKK